jgi:glycosyltransferase involved in cell wall biosynthesis
MKIAYLLDSISRKSGGLFDSCRELAQTIAHADNVTVLGVADEFSDVDLREWSPLQPRVFPSVGLRSFGYAPGYAKELTRVAPDIAHVQGLWTYHSRAAYRWSRRTGQPLIYSSHGMLDAWALRNSSWKKRLVGALWENAAHRSAACFHVLSEAEYRSVRAYGLRNPVCIIPNGMDLPEVSQRSEVGGQRSDIGGQTSEVSISASQFFSVSDFRAQGRKILLYLGRLHPKKNLAALIKAFAQLQRSEVGGRRSEEWVLVIAGWDQGGYEGELKRVASELGLSFTEVRGQRSDVRGQMSEVGNLISVVFAGPLFGEAKANTFRACDAFVLPSLSEGLPMSILEAWSYAKPVLMTPECNLPEGFSASAALRIGTTENEIAVGLKQLLEMTDDDRAAMGQRGRALVEERFSWAKIGQQMREVYEWILGGGAVPETVRME